MLLLLSVFFLVGIVQVAALRGKVVAGFGLSLITAAALLVTPKLMTSLIPVTWLSRYLGEHPGLRRAAASHALRTELSYSQAFLIQGGLAIRKLTDYDDLGAVLFGLGIVCLVATYLFLGVFQAAYRTTRDFKNLPAGSDWCRPMELDPGTRTRQRGRLEARRLAVHRWHPDHCALALAPDPRPHPLRRVA